MKKILLFAAAVIAMSCANARKHFCVICEAADSLNYYAALDSEAWDTTWWYPHSENFNEWYDSLTVLLVEDIDYCSPEEVRPYCYDLMGSTEFMKSINHGYDGLCGIEAYPKRFGKDAVIFKDSVIYVRDDIKDEYNKFQGKVDTVFKILYEEN